jgi:hypothetical protein
VCYNQLYQLHAEWPGGGRLAPVRCAWCLMSLVVVSQHQAAVLLGLEVDVFSSWGGLVVVFLFFCMGEKLGFSH